VRRLTLLVAAVALSGAGCEWMKNGFKPTPAGAGARSGPIPDYPAEVFVTYLNQQSDAIQGIEFDRVRISTESGPLLQQAVSLEGDLYCAKPRLFRLRAGLRLSPEEVDIGSNAQYFWMYVKRAQDPNFMYCSHDDYANGKVPQLPIPFDTEWVLQALGMTTYGSPENYHVEVRQKEREYALVSEGQTPQGVRVRKITVLAADREGENAPWVKKHVIMDAKGVPIATAEVRKVKAVSAGTDPQTGKATVVQIPTDLLLTVQGPDNQKVKLSLLLDKETVNPPTDERKQQYLFTLPKINGSTPINLAEYRFTPTARGQAPSRSRRYE
jgi:hypothetical protein